MKRILKTITLCKKLGDKYSFVSTCLPEAHVIHGAMAFSLRLTILYVAYTLYPSHHKYRNIDHRQASIIKARLTIPTVV